MPYVYRHFIPQNTAPKGAKRIGVYNADGEKICTIPLGRMTPTAKTKLYSFGVVSDIHLYKSVTNWDGNGKFDRALTCFENQGCEMCIVSGDLTQTGFYDEQSGGGYALSEAQFAKYKEICDKHTIPVYEICGNHESYYGMPITNNLDKLETYTGKRVLSYTVTQGNDLFILCGQPRDAAVMSDEDFTWLGETLEANKDKRCFVFVHSHIDDNVEGGVEDSGNPAFARENSIFGLWGATKTANFINLMKRYPNAILFHGHTHVKFEAQEFDKDANFSEENGFKSVHVPSCGSPRTLLDSEGNWTTNKGADGYTEPDSQGYIVDVYDDCIVLNGWDFVGNTPVVLGCYMLTT